jgi:hypothetical protein
LIGMSQQRKKILDLCQQSLNLRFLKAHRLLVSLEFMVARNF